MYGGEDSGYDDEAPQANLHAAIKSGSLKDVERILDGEADILAHYEGQTPLHTAVTSGRSNRRDVINLMLQNGADKDARTVGDNNTALHLLVQNGSFPEDIDLVVLFLDIKVDLSIRNKALRTPYDCAVALGQYELAACLDGTVPASDVKAVYANKLSQRYGPYIIEAVLQSDEKRLREYLNIGGNPNYINKHGCGAIHYAVTHSKLPVYDTLLLLLHAEVNPDLQDEERDTALNLVIKTKKLRTNGEMARCVQLLVDSGAHSDICDLDGKDACTLAEDREYVDVLAILKKPLLKKKTPTPSPTPSPEMLSPIIEAEEPQDDVNSPNADGLYPIHLATMNDNKIQREDKITSLLNKGADVNAKVVNTGNTSLHICAEKDYGETATLLLDNHINYQLKNQQGKTAYELAKANGHESVVKAIEEKIRQVRENWQKAKNKAKFCTIL